MARLPKTHVPLTELELEQLIAGDLSAFRNVFAVGVQIRLDRVAPMDHDDNRCQGILTEAAEITVAAGRRSEKLSLQGVAAIVNLCITRFLASSTSAVTDTETLGPNPLVSELKGLPPNERRAMTRFYLDDVSEEIACAEAGISLAAFRAIKRRFRLIMREAGTDLGDGGLGRLSDSLGPSVGCTVKAPDSGATRTVLKKIRDAFKGTA